MRPQKRPAANRGGRRYLPYAFTEQGVAMLSSVLSTEHAVAVNIEIMRAFVRMRSVLAANKELARRFAELETRLNKKNATQDKAIAAFMSAIRRLMNPQRIERLAAYWAEALGGPTMYSDSYGDETLVVKMHSGNGGHDEMDRRAIACFDQALADAGLAGDGALRQVLHDYFAWATTTTMSRYHQSADDVPNGLSIPRWSWDGLQS